MLRRGSSVPPAFQGAIDEALLKRTQDYTADKTRFGFVASFFGILVTVAFVFGGLLDRYTAWVVSLNLPFVLSGWIFFLILAFAGELLSTPFSLYGTFKIENKYGFNTMSPRLWISDFLKSLLLSAVLLSLVLFAAFGLISWSPRFWWLLVWAFLFAFSIFTMYISPYVIEPLFNKFTPLEDEALRERIRRLAEKAGIHPSRILRVDASKRSRHSNAYFTGIGKTKRIVLYDTLLDGASHDEILAVLSHEIGHWKKRHLLKMLVAFELVSFAGLFLAHRLVQGDLLTGFFALTTDTLFAELVLLAFIAGIVLVPVKPIVNYVSRKHEREADRASFELTGTTEGMRSVLVKLSKENLSNLFPHPLYAAMYYSHPPVLERIEYLKELQPPREKVM